MPIYRVNGKTYNIPDDKIEGFESKYPDATVEYHNEGKRYAIPLGKRAGFLERYPNASYNPAPTDKSQYTFTSEQLGLEPEEEDMRSMTVERQTSMPTPMWGTISVGENRREPVKDLGSASSGQGGISEYIEMLSGVKSEGQEKAEEQMRIAKERAASGERNWHPYGDTKKPLIESPDIRIGAADNVGLGSPSFNADIYADEAVRRAEEGLKPADGWTEATKRAQVNIANRNRQAQIKKAAEDAVGELRIKSNELSRRYEEADAKRPKIAIGNPTTFGGVLTEQGYYDRDYRNLNAANNILKKTEDMMADFASKQENGRLYNLGRGLITSTFDPDNWDFGFGDANVAERLLSVVEKADKDEPLSESEQLLLDAAINQQVMQGYYSELSGWQKAGKMFGESLPFMAQIAVNPLGSMSKYAGSKAAKAVLKHISKKVSKKAIERILARTAGLTAQTLGDLGTSYGMALTSNLGNTTADALNRQIGDIQYDFDDNGVARYNGRLNVKEAGEAWLDAANNQAFEFYSEQMGNYFAPILKGMGKLGGKALKNFGMDGVNRWVSDFAKKGSVRQLNQFFDKTQFHGFASEYAEEIANGMLNAAFVGDMTMEDVFSKDNLIDTAIGLSVMGAIGPMVGTAGYARAKYTEKQALNVADEEGRRLMGHAWDYFADAVRRSKNGEELSANLRETLNSFGRKALPGEDMRQILSYAQAYNRYKAVEEVSAAAVAEGVMDERDLELQRQYENGQTTTDKHGLRVTFEAAADAVEGIIPLNIGDNTAYDIADEYEEQGDTDTATAIRVFLSARAAHSGMTAQIREQAQSELESANAEIDSHTNKTDGNIYSVTLGGGLNGYVTGGTVITDSDGDIDIDATREANEGGYIYVNVDGVVKPKSVDDFVSLDGVESTADAKAAREAEINAALNAQYEELTAPVETQEAAPASTEVTPESAAPAETAAAPVNNTPIVSNEVAENAARALGVLPEELEEVILDEQEGLERAARYNNIGDTDSADAIRAYVAERFGTPAVQPAQVNNATAAEVGNKGADKREQSTSSLDAMPSESNLGEANGAENIPTEQAPEAPAIPVEKRGKEERQAFHLVPVERTTEELYNSGLNQQEIDAFVQANIDEINSDIEKHSKKQPKMGANIAAYKAAKEEWQAQNEDLSARLNYYKGLQEHIKGITTSNTAEAINDPIADVSDITTPEEFIAAQLGGIKITPESFRKETGLSATEQKALVGVIAGKDKGGVSVERAAEIITDNYSEELAGLGFKGDMMDVRNAIIDILSGGNPKTYAKRTAEARQMQVVDERRDQMDYIARQLGFDSVDEMIAYEETLLPRIIEQYAGFDESTYYSILVNDYNNDYDTTRESETVGRGGEVLQDEQPTNASGTEPVGTGRQGGAAASSVQSNGANVATPGNQEVSEPVGNSEQLSSSEIPNNQSVAEGDAPGQRSVSKAELQDARAFAEAYSLNTVEAYQAYLDRFPEGAYRNGARNGMWVLEGAEEANSEAIERAMDVISQAPSGVYADNQGNPVDAATENRTNPTESRIAEKHKRELEESSTNEGEITRYSLNTLGSSSQMLKDIEALRKSNREEFEKIQPVYEYLYKAKERGLYPDEIAELKGILKGTSLESKVDSWFTPVVEEQSSTNVEKSQGIEDNSTTGGESGSSEIPNNSTISQDSEQVGEQVEKKAKAKKGVEKIEDVGEKIGGAKKDKLRETIDRMKTDIQQSDETLIDKIANLPISKIFNFDFQKLREGGMPNDAISFMEIVRKSIPAKPRTSHKVRRWVNNTLALYKLCLEVGTNWDKVNTVFSSRDFAGTDLKAQYDAYMSVGGFDSGLNIGNAKLKQLDKTAGYYKDGKFISSEGKWYVRDAGKHSGIYDTKEDAVEALKAFAGDNAGTTESGKKKEVKFAVYQRREDKSIFIAIKGKSDIVIQDGFKSAKEAFDYIGANNAELQSRYRNLLDKTNADFEENRERKGRDYRDGKDVSAEEFRSTFGFRGVEFGNWMAQEDRKKAINECYDALMDLAEVCKVSPRALSLDGTLAMAFGARGGGKFSAHYEPGKVVINMTKTRGAGSLAHEWFHALDNYFAKMGKDDIGIYATAGEGMLPEGFQKIGDKFYDKNSHRMLTAEEAQAKIDAHKVRAEMASAWNYLMNKLKKSDYYKRSNAYARLHNSKYWNNPTELGARAFSIWVENELSKQDISNDYLANNPRYIKSEVTDAQDKYMPYPFDTDADWMDEAFGNLFEVMQEKVTEKSNIALYQRGSLSLESDNPTFKAATEKTMQALEKTGVEVVMATEEQVNAMMEIAEMQKRKSPETALPEDESSFKGTVISSDDGAKILKDIDNAIAEYENKGNSAKTFIGDVARILRAVRRGSKSEYADIITANGILVRIRLADHNVKVSNYDNAGINNGISIVISRKPNENITNDGDAHLVEFFYSDKKISKSDGKPLVEILKSIKQALYSGEYKDNTGLAVREEVNMPEFHRVYHGSGAKFDRFDHSFMGTGEGAQAYGWGTYVTEVEGIGKSYAGVGVTKLGHLQAKLGNVDSAISLLEKEVQKAEKDLTSDNETVRRIATYTLETASERRKALEEEKATVEEEMKSYRNLYSVEIPDDNGSNYLYWEKPVNGEIQERVANGLQSIGFEFEPEMNHLAYSRDGKIAVLNINAKGKDLYAELSEALGGDKAASQFLNDLGFVGISYPAEAMTGGREDGERNYVIFNENDAQITDRVEFLRTANGTVYGWTVNGKIYLTPDGINPNTPVHEYTHLWASAIEQNDPKLWSKIVEAMKQSPVWNEVMADEAYRDIWNDDNRVASEVLSRLSGNENYRRTMQEAALRENDPTKKFGLIAAWGRVKRALADFWDAIKGLFGADNATPWEQFVNSAIGDFYKGVNPNVQSSPMEGMFIGEKGAANLDKAEEATIRLDNLAIAREMEAAEKDAKSIKMATGWERGADGKWRYETEDVRVNKEAKLYDFGINKKVSLSEMKDGKIESDSTVKLSELINDNELFAAYPEMKGYYVTFEQMDENILGSHDREGKVIRINRNAIGLLPDNEGRSVNSTLAHEIQHAVQSIEGFAKGGSSDMVDPETNIKLGKSGYKRLAGEVESRNVQKRMNMSAEERRASLAEKTEDVARKDQIFLYDNLGESAMDAESERQKHFHDMIDDLYSNGNVDKSKYAMTYFHVAETPAFMENIGLAGAEFTIPFKAISTHIGKDADHKLTADIWHELPNALQHPFLVTKYGEDGRFRIYTTLLHNGKYVAVGVDVKRINQGRNKPIVEINSIKTVFAKTGRIGETETVVCYDERITPEQEALLNGRNFRQYPTIQELSAAKGSENISNSQENNDIRFRSVGGNGGYDFRPKRGESTEQREERMNNYTNEIITILKERGFDVTNSRSRTSFGMSNYVNVYSPVGRFLEKIRISDHSVLRNSRVLDEYNPLPTQSPADVVADLFGNNTGDMYREGEGAYTDEEINFANDPVSKVLGKPRGTKKKQREFAARQRQRMAERVESLAKKLHLDNVEIITDASALEGKKQRAKGFYSKSTGKITIVIPNHSSAFDVEQTLLHEAVAHYGLRQLFGEHFDTFLDNVFKNADVSIRKRIIELAQKKNWDLRTATEEYLASLAEETNFENTSASWWRQIKELFLNMLHKIGFEDFGGVTLTDNELRYILWRSYENLAEPGKFRSILGEVSDIAKQYELKVGNYAQNSTDASTAAENNDLFRDGDPEIHERALARDRYERRVKTGMFQSKEALQDSMLGLKEAMQAILGKGTNIEDVAGFENAYLGENRLSSVNKAEADAFAHTLFKSMLDEVAKLARTEAERDELTDYMMAKHGLERNAYMRNEAIKNGATDADQTDYAGLTALTGMDNVADAETEAQRMVDDYEQAHDTTDLWEKVNAVSKAILQKSYECGMMSKETFDKVSNMYEFYIPLRGFDEKTSSEAYAYLTHKDSAFNAPIKTAKGRKSKADDPFANLQSMAESAIMQGNRNRLVKQRFFNFVLNHPSDLVSISDLWVGYDDVADEWKPVFPDNINSSDTPEEVEKKMQDFEAKMESLAQQHPDQYKKGKDAVGIPYRVVESRDMREHQIIVKRGGRDYVITINGNPRAAQAINGLTNPDNEMVGAIGAILRTGEKINRLLSAAYTTRNPDFIISNFMRDMLYSNSMVWIKESPNYALRFHRNFLMVNPVTMKRLLAKYRKGTLDMSDKTEAMFHQFMMNGGETGYTNTRDIEQHKNDISKELKQANGKLKLARYWSLLWERLDELNRAIENCARFAAFVTSREMGRSIDRSIYDAKEISVNFNKKGSGAKLYGSVGQTTAGNASAMVSGLGRSGFVFWNAAIQGTTNFGRQVKRHPAKAFTGMATMFLLGAIVAYLGGDDDEDDKNAYYNLPEYVRRSNILFRVGDSWISIPLPIEYRAIYGMGELMTSVFSGKEHLTGGEIAGAVLGQATQILPIDFLEGGGGLNAFVPSAAKPLWEAYVAKKSWTGLPLYKDNPWNENLPEWTKAYKSANKYIVNLAAVLNEETGGDAHTKGAIDINPAKIEYMLNGYFGGVASTIDKLTKTAETIVGDREYDPRSILLWNRLVKAGDESTEYRAVNNEYYRLKEERDETMRRLRAYEKDADNGILDYLEKIDFLYNSPEYERALIFDSYYKDGFGIRDYDKALKEETDDEIREELVKEQNELKRELIKAVKNTYNK